MGFFDAPAPLFALISGLLRLLLPGWAMIVVWGLLVGALGTALYWLLSPQKRIVEVRAQGRAVRNALLRYDGDFDGVLALTRAALALALKEVWMVIGPASAAALPAFCAIAYLGNVYDYVLPSAGTMVPVRVEPASAAISFNPLSAVDSDGGMWLVKWPTSGNEIELESSRGRILKTFPLRKAIPVIQKFTWWNVFFGNPDGYLPRSAGVSSIELEFPPRTFLPVGPAWLRGWETIFFLAAFVSALTFRKLLAVQ